jgi:hypothetical protein
MNLGQMSTFVTQELGLYDATSIALCNSFCDKAYRILWDKYPWKDTSAVAKAQVNAGTNFVNYPDGMDRIISVRASNGTTGSPPSLDAGDYPPPADPFAPAPIPLDSRFLDPIDSDFLIDSEPLLFEARGYVKYYEETGTASQRQIRLYPIPTFGVTLLFFGKMLCPGLNSTADISQIRNLDEVIIAYAYFDMLQRQRQYAKAQQKRQEAQELEANAWKLEQEQANKPRRSKTTTVAGNSLSEMTDAVCTICGQWTPEYRLIIKEFLRRNYGALYDGFLWPESVLAVKMPYTTEQIVLPNYVDKVLGVRGTTNFRLFPADAVLFLDITPSIFEELGDPIGYTVLTPVAVSTLPASTTQLALASTNALDRGKVFIRGEIIASGVETYEEITLNGTNIITSTKSYDIPLTIAKDITYGDVTVNAIAGATIGINLEVIPAAMREVKHQRLWFLPVPDPSKIPAGQTAFHCLVLAKRQIRPLQTDQDTPIVTGAQQVLVHAAAADLFRKLDKTDASTAMQGKADAAMKALIAKNTDQAASSPRFVPDVEPRAYWSSEVCRTW